MTTVKPIRLAAVAAGVAAFVSVFGVSPASAASTPVELDQKVNVEGTKDVSKKSRASIKQELDDKYFAPTFVKAKANEKITFRIANEGKLPHTFTSDVLSVDKEVQPGMSAKFSITVPSDGNVFTFYCAFHESDGMVGAIYTRAGASASGSS